MGYEYLLPNNLQCLLQITRDWAKGVCVLVDLLRDNKKTHRESLSFLPSLGLHVSHCYILPWNTNVSQNQFYTLQSP